MGRLFRVNRARSQFEEDLYFEILKSERLRARILMVFLGGLCVLGLGVAFALPREWNPIDRLLGGRFPARAIAIFSGAAFLYELTVHTVVGQVIRRRFHVPEFPRYGNALVETSFPSILLMVLSRAVGPEIALNSPLPMLYFLFISLSTLRLTAPLSIFTGCVAGAEFTLL